MDKPFSGPFVYSRGCARSALSRASFMSPPKYVDLIALALALPVFLLGDFPLLGYAVGAGVWLVQRAVQSVAARRAKEELAHGERQRAMGIVAGTGLGRVWLMAA